MNADHSIEHGRIIIIDIDGILNGETARALESNIDSLLVQGKRSLILNGKNLSFVTSHGISSLISSIQRITGEGGKAALVELNSEVESLLSVLQITKFLNVYPTKQDAIDSFKNSLFPSDNVDDQYHGEEDLSVPNSSRFTIEEKEESDFDSPLIIECATCGALVRVYRPGEYICPGCKTQFRVNRDGTAVF